MDNDKIMIVDYSEKAIAIAAEYETALKDEFKLIGGRFNFRLGFGPGWIFSKKKCENQITRLFAEYDLTDMISRVKLSDIISDTDKANKRGSDSLPDYILTDEARKEWITATHAKYYRKDAIKEIAVCIRLSDGGILAIESGKLKTEFWFGESDFGQGPTSEEANESAHKASTDESYFLDANLSDFRDIISGLKGEQEDNYKYLHLYTCGLSNGKKWKLRWSNLNPDSVNWQEFLESWEREQYERGEHRALTDDDRERLIAGYTYALELREKRCRAYLKRYGLSKIHASTYWMDR